MAPPSHLENAVPSSNDFGKDDANEGKSSRQHQQHVALKIMATEKKKPQQKQKQLMQKQQTQSQRHHQKSSSGVVQEQNQNLLANFGRERARIDHSKIQSLADILNEAGVSLTDEEMKQIPALEKIMKELYGPLSSSSNNQTTSSSSTKNNLGGPVIYGMDTCEAYRQLVPKVKERYVAPAGMFNTGTNNLFLSMRHNMDLQSTKVQAYYQVPWGKHRMETKRLHHNHHRLADLNQTKCLPIVIVRDPFHWMQSMCRTSYTARWKKGPKRCPNLVPSERDHKRFKSFYWDESKIHSKHYDPDHELSTTRNNNNQTKQDEGDETTDEEPPPLPEEKETFQVRVKFDNENDIEYFDSLVDLWNDWYGLYWWNEKKYPRLIVRFEDMLQYAPLVIEKVAECLGIPMKQSQFQYVVDSAKGHGSHTDFIKAILKTANATRRELGLTESDKIYASRHLDSTMMEAFQYRYVT